MLLVRDPFVRSSTFVDNAIFRSTQHAIISLIERLQSGYTTVLHDVSLCSQINLHTTITLINKLFIFSITVLVYFIGKALEFINVKM